MDQVVANAKRIMALIKDHEWALRVVKVVCIGSWHSVLSQRPRCARHFLPGGQGAFLVAPKQMATLSTRSARALDAEHTTTRARLWWQCCQRPMLGALCRAWRQLRLPVTSILRFIPGVALFQFVLKRLMLGVSATLNPLAFCSCIVCVRLLELPVLRPKPRATMRRASLSLSDEESFRVAGPRAIQIGDAYHYWRSHHDRCEHHVFFSFATVVL